MQSKAKTPKEYFASLPPDRRREMEIVRKVILKNLPKGYKEMMGWGMISYSVPLSTYPDGYGENPEVPLPYVALGNQKNYMVVHLMGVYGEGEAAFRAGFKAAGKKLDMGKGCVRFKRAEDLALGVIGKEIAKVSVRQLIAKYEKARLKTVAGRKAAAKKAATKKKA